MDNPWKDIDLKIYEKHMSSNEVLQLQMLNNITKEQLGDNPHYHVGILGVAGGNGLDNINVLVTKKVYAIDINENYINACKMRYKDLGDVLELLCVDITDDKFCFPSTNLLICNLIIEYIGDREFVSIINKNRANIDVVSCVIQRNNNNLFVSSSQDDSHFEPILSIHHDIDEQKLKELFSSIEFKCIKTKNYTLPNGKEFIRMDLKKQI